MEARHAALKTILREIGPCLVAFSGGIDSTLLLKVAHDVLGDDAVAITAVSPSLPESERLEAGRLARWIGAPHRFVETREMDDPRYVANDERRCFFCKTALFDVMKTLAVAGGERSLIYGAIADDLGDDRPGMRAAAAAGVRAPLIEAGFSKDGVRSLARALQLPNWDKPAMACLASRIPRNRPVTSEALHRVELAEAALRAIGYRQVRVRVEDEDARVEFDAEGLRASAEPRERRRVIAAVRAAGFRIVTIDPRGYRPGGRTAAAS